MISTIRAAGALAVAPLLAARALAQFEDVGITSEKLADGLWMLEGRGGNLAVSVGDEGVLLVDDQFAALTEKIRAKIAELGGGDVRFVLNTHFHGDHTGGNAGFADLGGVIVAHENVRLRMGTSPVHPLRGEPRKPAPEESWPIVTFGEDVTFWFNGEEIRVFHVELAHTDGDAIVQFVNANVLHVGDVLFSEHYPLIDWGVDGHIDGVVSACERILGIADEDTKIVCGHGPLANASRVREYRDMLATVARRVREAVAAGKSLEEIQAAKPTAEFDAEWGGGFVGPDAFVRMVHIMMTR